MATSRSHRATVPTPMEFVQAWQTSSGVAEVASKLRMRKDQVRVRACRYRKKGVPLKQYEPAENPGRDWDEIAAYAASLAPQDDPAAGVQGSGHQPPDGEGLGGASEGGDKSSACAFSAAQRKTATHPWKTLPWAPSAAHRQTLHRRTARQERRHIHGRRIPGHRIPARLRSPNRLRRWSLGTSQGRWKPHKGVAIPTAYLS